MTATRARGRTALAIGLLGAVVAIVSLVGYRPLERFTVGRGQPDPGGQRLAAIRAFAPRALPTQATDVAVRVRGYRWDRHTCDGGAPGWASADVEQTFHAPNDLPSILDAQLRQLGWKPADEGAQPASAPQPAQPPAGSRVYVPEGTNPSGETAVLTPPETFGGGRWDLDISADPAEHPAHDC